MKWRHDFSRLNRGQSEFSVVEGAATNGSDIELRVDTGKNLTKNEVDMAVEFFKKLPAQQMHDIPAANVPAV